MSEIFSLNPYSLLYCSIGILIIFLGSILYTFLTASETEKPEEVIKRLQSSLENEGYKVLPEVAVKFSPYIRVQKIPNPFGSYFGYETRQIHDTHIQLSGKNINTSFYESDTVVNEYMGIKIITIGSVAILVNTIRDEYIILNSL